MKRERPDGNAIRTLTHMGIADRNIARACPGPA